MQRSEQSDLNVRRTKMPPPSDDEEMTDHEHEQVMMSMGPPTQVDTSLINLGTQTNDMEIMRMIQQYLQDKGYADIASQLEHQSNVRMEEASVLSFRQSILDGDFHDVPSLVSQLLAADATHQRQDKNPLTLQKREFVNQE